MYESQIDAIEDWSSKAVDAYNDYIDVVKKSLDAERDLYEFKKNIEKQTKDIAELERKIASLSGSDNKADIAERRKLEAQLYDAKEGLNDTYYDHAKSAQDEALDKENEAYAKSLENYTEKLRETLDQAQLNMEQFMQNVTASVMLNAETVRTEYTNTGIDIDVALTTPWDNAIAAMQGYEVDGLSQMNAWLSEDGYFGKFLSTATYDLTTPWGVGTNAVNAFKNSVSTTMSNIVSNITRNVNTIAGELSTLYSKIQDTQKKASEGVTITTTYKSVYVDVKEEARKAAQDYIDSHNMLESDRNRWGQDPRFLPLLRAYLDAGGKATDLKGKVRKYATGTTGTKKDQWAITDEPQYGDELVLVPNAAGNLSFMRKGTSVVPADITANLVEWGKLNPNMMSITNPSAGVNVISNAINKPELNFTFDSLVHVDHCDEGTLKDLEKMVDTKINDFTRRLNYSIKKFS